ncbi:hypothetical protein BGZ76_009621 [Entomortierella beljakovae]|nr:hypothetical protein BGZ76_009621 [Entomortierella beljakovae]
MSKISHHRVTPSSSTFKNHTSRIIAQQKCFQDRLPTEIWQSVLEFIPSLDLFSLYNTSTYMRALSAPFLVSDMASKTLQLYFYQEYIRRIGIRFEFDHFDLKRDRMVYRIVDTDLQHRFRCGLTLQSPHLEEIAVFTPAGPGIAPHQVRCAEGRYYTVHPQKVARGKLQAIKKSPEQLDAPVSHVGPELALGSSSESVSNTNATSSASNTTVISTATSAITSATTSATTHSKRVSNEERGYHGTKNFLDKSCPVSIRKDGVHELDGSKYCFLQGYPWSLQYQVSYDPYTAQLDHKNSSTRSGGNQTNAVSPKKRDQFFFDLRADMRAEAQARAEAQRQVHQQEESGVMPEETAVTANNNIAIESEQFDTQLLGDSSSSSNSGARYFRTLRFECSMNFLDLKRATRNIIGRWLEGKVQRWKKVLGSKKQSIQYPIQQIHHQHEMTSQPSEFSSTTTTITTPTKKKQNRKVIQVIDSILGPPAKPLNQTTTTNRNSRLLENLGNGYFENTMYNNNNSSNIGNSQGSTDGRSEDRTDTDNYSLRTSVSIHEVHVY